MSKRFINWILVVVSFVGILDAGYLTMQHYVGGSIGCNAVGQCDVVVSSVYSEIFGIPVALGGLLLYIIIFLLALAYLKEGYMKVPLYLVIFTVIGFVASLAFVYIQLFILKSICLYCTISALGMTVLFLSSVLLRERTRLS